MNQCRRVASNPFVPAVLGGSFRFFVRFFIFLGLLCCAILPFLFFHSSATVSSLALSRVRLSCDHVKTAVSLGGSLQVRQFINQSNNHSPRLPLSAVLKGSAEGRTWTGPTPPSAIVTSRATVRRVAICSDSCLLSAGGWSPVVRRAGPPSGTPRRVLVVGGREYGVC